MSSINSKRLLNIQSNNAFQIIKKSLWAATYCFILLSSKVILPSLPQTTLMPPSGTSNNYYQLTANPINNASSNQHFNQQSNQKNTQDTSVKVSQQSTQDTNVNVSHSVDIKHTVDIKLLDIDLLKEFKKYLSDQYDSSKKDCNSLLQSTCDTMIEHKWKLIGLTLIASYGVIAYKIYQTEQHLQQHNSWCNWKSVIPLQHLMLTQTTDLISQLNFDMYSKYGIIIQNMSDTASIPDLFLYDLQAELGLLDRYASLLNIASRFHCQSLFCFNYSIDMIEEKRARLMFVYNLFIMIQTQQKR